MDLEGSRSKFLSRTDVDEHAVDRALRERYVAGLPGAAVSSMVMGAALCWLFWASASRTGLVAWAIAISVTGLIPIVLDRMVEDMANWRLGSLLAEVLNGVSWGLITVLAMPFEPVEQAALSAVLACLVIAAATFAQFIELYLVYIVSVVGVAYTGFVIGWEGEGFVPIVVLVIALGFSIASAFEVASAQRKLSRSVLENGQLVETLSAEQELLQAVNLRLDTLIRLDPLTGVANRLAFSEHLQSAFDGTAASAAEPAVLAYLDLDGFKAVNDTHGHQLGDALLRAVASRLEHSLRSDELLARLGGDEFCVLSEGGEPAELGQRLVTAFDTPLLLEGNRMDVGVSVGVAKAGEGAADPDSLIRAADSALYITKKRAGNSFEVADVWIDDQSAENRLAS